MIITSKNAEQNGTRLSHFASYTQGRFIPCFSPRITPRDSPSRAIPAQRHSSISMGQIAKVAV